MKTIFLILVAFALPLTFQAQAGTRGVIDGPEGVVSADGKTATVWKLRTDR